MLLGKKARKTGGYLLFLLPERRGGQKRFSPSPIDRMCGPVYNKYTPWGYTENGGTAMAGQEKCCCKKTTERTEEERTKLIHRLNRIEGQIRGIRGMVEQDAYCADILVQSSAVSAAVNAFNRELLANHIRGCVARDIRAGNDDVIDELLSTLQKLMK